MIQEGILKRIHQNSINNSLQKIPFPYQPQVQLGPFLVKLCAPKLRNIFWQFCVLRRTMHHIHIEQSPT